MPVVDAQLTNMLLSPTQYPDASTGQLLTEAALGYVPFDQQLVKELISRAPESIDGLVSAAMNPPEDLRVDLRYDLFHVLRQLRTPKALPFFIELLHEQDDEDPDEIYMALSELGEAAIEPLIELYNTKGPKAGGNAAFLLASLRKPDPRIRSILIARLDIDPWDTALCLSLYGDPETKPAIEAKIGQLDPVKDAEAVKELTLALNEINSTVVADLPDPYNCLDAFAEHGEPAFDALDSGDVLAYFDSPEATYRSLAVEAIGGEEPTAALDKRLLAVATTDSEVTVRAAAWEALATSPAKDVKQALRAKAMDSKAVPMERAAAVASLTVSEYNADLGKLAVQLYNVPEARALAMKAMWQTLRADFAEYFPSHLADDDPDIRRQAIWGVGYLGLSAEAHKLESMFEDEDFRDHALFAYALCVPGDITRAGVKKLYQKIDELADGLSEEEQEAVESAFDQRLQMRGLDPVYQPLEKHVHDENCGHDHGHSHSHSHAAPVEPAKSAKAAGRNDPCPCGSGKKYKKCCGA